MKAAKKASSRAVAAKASKEPMAAAVRELAFAGEEGVAGDCDAG
jgi:hypothetical protein